VIDAISIRRSYWKRSWTRTTPPSSATYGRGRVAALARKLYDWKGRVDFAHVHGADFAEGGGFSDEAEGNAWRAARLIEELLASPSST
jgi:hypothetical protein